MLGLVPRTASTSSKMDIYSGPVPKCCFGFLLPCTCIPCCEFWICIAMLHTCNRCHEVLRHCSPKHLYSAFYASPVIAVVSLHRPLFQVCRKFQNRVHFPQSTLLQPIAKKICYLRKELRILKYSSIVSFPSHALISSTESLGICEFFRKELIQCVKIVFLVVAKVKVLDFSQ